MESKRVWVAFILVILVGCAGCSAEDGAVEETGVSLSENEPAIIADEVPTIISDPEQVETAGLQELVAALASPNTEVVWAARNRLEEIGYEAIAPLVALLKDLNRPWPPRWSALRVLGRIGVRYPEEVMPALIWSLEDREAEIAKSAATALGSIGSEASKAVPQLADIALVHRNLEVRANAVDALARIGVVNDHVLGAIGLALGETDFVVAMAGNRAVQTLGTDRESLAPVLVNILREGEVAADRVMSAFGRLGRVIVPPLEQMLVAEDAMGRAVIARVLGQAMPASIPVLLDLVGDEDERVRSAAVSALGRARSHEETIVPVLLSVAMDATAAELTRTMASRSLLGLIEGGRVFISKEEAAIIEAQAGSGLEFFVAQNGNDAWSGTLSAPNADETDGPFRSIAGAMQVMMPGDTCTIREGVYRETLRPIQSGVAGKPITFRGYEGEAVVFTGTDPVSGWELYEGSIYRAKMDWDLGDLNQIFAGNELMLEARWPNGSGAVLQPERGTITKADGNKVTDTSLPNFPDDTFWEGAYFWCAGGLAWATWAVDIVGFDPQTKTFTLNQSQLDRAIGYSHEHYFPRQGNKYMIMGTKGLLDSEGEWWYDSAEGYLYLWAPGGVNPEEIGVEARARMNMVDLSDREYIHIQGVKLLASGVVTNDATRYVVLDGLRARYLVHSYRREGTTEATVLLSGSHNEIRNSEFAYSSGSLLRVSGDNHRIINSYFHHGNYNANFSGLARIAGENHLISHNTFSHAGRDVLNIGGISASIIQYNILSDAGWIVHDLGMTYGHTNDFQNTVIRYNWIHDNRSPTSALGIYFDHVSRNVIVHNNVIWNVQGDPIRVNNPGYFVLVFNNTAYNTWGMRTYDWSRRNDLFGTIVANNIYPNGPNLPENVTLSNNLVTSAGFTNPTAYDFSLRANSSAIDAGRSIRGITDGYTGSAPDIGAYPYGVEPWVAGHDFSQSPNPEFVLPQIEFMNLVQNSCFDDGTLDYWQQRGSGDVRVVTGNDWGRNPEVATGTGRHEVRLSGSDVGIQQKIDGLEPNTTYRFSAWVRLSNPGETAVVGVSDGEQTIIESKTESTDWTNQMVTFRTGPQQDSVSVYLHKLDGEGHLFSGNIGLQKAFDQ